MLDLDSPEHAQSMYFRCSRLASQVKGGARKTRERSAGTVYVRAEKWKHHRHAVLGR